MSASNDLVLLLSLDHLAGDRPNKTMDVLLANSTSNELSQELHLPPFESVHQTERDSLYVVLPIIIIYVLIFVSGIVGNIGTCIVIARNRSMQTATNYYLFSLAISDLLLLVSGVPQEINLIWNRYPPIPGGHLNCILRALVAELSCNATVLTITAFTVERYLAICHPFLAHTLSKPSRAIRLIGIIWLVSMAVALVQAQGFRATEDEGRELCLIVVKFFEHFFEVSTFLFFFVPMTLITVLYVLIGFKLRASSGAQLVKSNEGQRRHGSATKSQRRVLKMLVAVVVAFFFCWAPFHAQRLVAIYFTADLGHASQNIQKIYTIVTYISGVLYYLSTCINPLLYSIMSHKFREAFKAVLFRRHSAGGRASLNRGSSGTLRGSGGAAGGSGVRRGATKSMSSPTALAVAAMPPSATVVPARKVSAHPLLSNTNKPSLQYSCSWG